MVAQYLAIKLILTLLNLNLADSFNLLVNNGAAAGQVIFHVSEMLWILFPRYFTMTIEVLQT